MSSKGADRVIKIGGTLELEQEGEGGLCVCVYVCVCVIAYLAKVSPKLMLN